MDNLQDPISLYCKYSYSPTKRTNRYVNGASRNTRKPLIRPNTSYVMHLLLDRSFQFSSQPSRIYVPYVIPHLPIGYTHRP